MGFVSRHRWPIICGVVGAVAGGPALAQDFTQGKSPAQLFAGDCAACHKSPQGLAKGDARSIAGFLREHYTTKPEMADALAAYLLASGGGRASASNDAGRSDWNRNDPNRNADGLRPRVSIPIGDDTKPPEAGEAPKPSAKLRGTAPGDTGKPTDNDQRRPRSTSTTGDAPKSTDDGGPRPLARVAPDAKRDADDDTLTDAPKPKPRTVIRDGLAPVPVPVPTGKLNAYARSGSSDKDKDKVTDSPEARLSKLRSYATSGDAAPPTVTAPPKAVASPPPAEPTGSTNPEPSSDTERAAVRQEPKLPSEDPARFESNDAPKPAIDDASKPPKPQRPTTGDGNRSQDGANARPVRRDAANTPSSPMSFLGRILSGGAKRDGDPTN